MKYRTRDRWWIGRNLPSNYRCFHCCRGSTLFTIYSDDVESDVILFDSIEENITHIFRREFIFIIGIYISFFFAVTSAALKRIPPSPGGYLPAGNAVSVFLLFFISVVSRTHSSGDRNFSLSFSRQREKNPRKRNTEFCTYTSAKRIWRLTSTVFFDKPKIRLRDRVEITVRLGS